MTDAEERDLHEAVATLANLGEGAPHAVRIRGPQAVLDFTRQRLAALDAEAAEREREAQDGAAEAELEGDAAAEVPSTELGPGVTAVPLTEAEREQASVDLDAEIQRGAALGAALEDLEALRAVILGAEAEVSLIYSRIEEYLRWCGEVIEDLHKRAHQLGSTIEYVPESPVEETFSDLRGVRGGSRAQDAR